MLAPVEFEHLVDALAFGEACHGLNEILVVPVDDLGRAIAKRARFLACRAYGSDDGRAGARGELGCEQAHAAADGVDENDVARLGYADIVKEMPCGEPLDGKGRRNFEPHVRRDRDQPLDPRYALIGEAARFLQEGRDAVADLRADDAWSERCDPPRDLEAADDRIALRVRIGSADDHRVGEIAAAIGDVDQRLSGTRNWLRGLAYPQIAFRRRERR